jgi:hypothetical protein
MDRTGLLLLGSRSRLHRWLLLVAKAGGAVVVGGAAVLAAAHGHHHLALWRVALVAVVAVAILTLVAVAGAFLTEPVPPDHADRIRESAGALAATLESGNACDYGGDLAKQAFCEHFPKLAEQLVTWDEVARAPSSRERALDAFIDHLMYEHNVTGLELDATYNPIEMRKYAHAVAMARARGRLQEMPQIEWAGFTDAGDGTSGSQGLLGPNGGIADWILLPPLDGETASEWNDRAELRTQRVDGLMAAVYETLLPAAQAVLAAEQRLEDFKRDELPVALDALRRVQVREAPRWRWRCASC